jgi:release factor glutamine methyltransferase
MVNLVMPSTIAGLLVEARQALQNASEPYLEAQVLLACALQQPRSYLLAHPDAEVKGPAKARFLQQLEARRLGQPLAYILGQREFWSLNLTVSAATLIPRPETELLVEQALARLPRGPRRVLDLGTGAGAIALALKTERPELAITAVDKDTETLAVARGNGQRLGLEIEWLASDWFSGLPARRFHLIVANPPYVASGDPHLNQGDSAFEPRLALEAGPLGLDALHIIIDAALPHLEPGGDLLLEHGYHQAPAVRDRLEQTGFDAIASYRDLQQHERITVAQAPKTRLLEKS